MKKCFLIMLMFSGTIVYGRQVATYNSGKYKGFVHEGGSRSSKTTSIIQFLLTWAERQEHPKRVIIARARNTWTRATVLYDFVNVMKEYKVYDTRLHNKTDGIIKYHKVEFWFGGLDDPQKIHGFTSDGFWLNEAVEVSKEDFDQLEMRCNGFFILDYNPNMDTEHWICKSILTRTDVKYIHSTVIDNPFAPDAVVAKILSYKPTPENIARGSADKNKWEIYGLGIIAKIEGLVYEKWDIVTEIPVWVKGNRFTGLDFGYTNDVTAIDDIYIWKPTLEIWADEYCYQTGLTNPQIAKRLMQNKAKKVWADSSEPKSIAEISNAGVNIYPVKKGPDSVINGIDIVKRWKIHFTERSINAIREIKNYKYMQDKNSKYLNEPIDDFNHFMDLIRYVLMMECPIEFQGSPNDLAKIFY